MNAQVQLDSAMRSAERGNFSQAIGQLSQIIEALPTEGVLFQALGSVLLQAGKAEDAVPVLQHARTLLGDPVDVLELLGVAFARSGQPGEALEVFDQLLEKTGESTTAAVFRNRGNVLVELGRTEEAILSFQGAVAQNPQDHLALGNWGLALKALGRREKAVEAFKKAIGIAPESPEYRLNLGNTLADMGQLDAAEPFLRQVCEEHPDSALAHAALGRILCGTSRTTEALALLKRACELAPTEAKFHLNYGAVLAMTGHVTEPLDHFTKAIRIKPNYWAAWVDMGNLLSELGRVEESQRCFEVVLEREPQHQDASAGLASRYLRKGEPQKALDLLAPFISMESVPSVNVAVSYATACMNLKRPEDSLQVIQRLLERPRPKPEQSLLLHAAGRAFDQLKKYSDAFRAYEQSNALRCLEFSPAQHERDITQTIEEFDTSSLEQIQVIGSDSESPIFIVGMPRSGTSLVEQILCSHDAVHGAGELEFVRLAASLLSKQGSVRKGLEAIDSQSFSDLAENHLNDLKSQAGGARFITDKMPSNFLYLGLIQKLYPNARIIHCRRSKLDTCISCFRQNFNASYAYSTRLEWLNAFYVQYERLMAHWKAVLELPIYEVDYEALVASPDREIPELLSFCGLDVQESCLSPHKNDRVVHTASHSQVRQPIYTSSVGYAERYKGFLEALTS